MPEWQSANTIETGGAPSNGVWEAFAATAIPTYKAAMDRQYAKEDEQEQLRQKFDMLMKMQEAKSKSEWDLEQDKQENALRDRSITQGQGYLDENGKFVSMPMFDKNGNLTAAQRAKQRLEYAKIFSAAGHQDPFGMADNALDDDILRSPGASKEEKDAILARRQGSVAVSEDPSSTGVDFSKLIPAAGGAALPFLGYKAFQDRLKSGLNSSRGSLIGAKLGFEQAFHPPRADIAVAPKVPMLGYSGTGTQMPPQAIEMPRTLASHQFDKPVDPKVLGSRTMSEDALQAAYKSKYGLKAAQNFLKGSLRGVAGGAIENELFKRTQGYDPVEALDAISTMWFGSKKQKEDARQRAMDSLFSS